MKSCFATFSLAWLLAMLAAAANPHAPAQANADAHTNTHWHAGGDNDVASAQAQKLEQQQQEQRQLATYALYNVPPIEVTFKSRAGQEFELVDDGDGSDSARVGVEGIGGNSDSGNPKEGTAGGSSTTGTTTLKSLEFPLRAIAQRQLLDYFQAQISELLEDPAKNTTGSTEELYNHLVAFDFTIESIDIIETKRKLRDGRTPRRWLEDDVTIRALMTGSLAFLEPRENVNKPSNEEVFDLFGDWMRVYFATSSHKQDFWRALTKSSNKVLSEIVDLDVIVDPGTNSNGDVNGRSSGAWSANAERTILIVLAMMITTTVCLVAVKWHIRSRSYKFATYYDEYSDDGDESNLDPEYGESESRGMWSSPWGAGRNASNNGNGSGGDPFQEPRPNYQNPGPLPDLSKPSLFRAGSLDAVRHGQYANYASSNHEALSILQASDRYLSKHRPEWIRENEGGNSQNATADRASAFSFYGGDQPASMGHQNNANGSGVGGMIPAMMSRTYNVLPSNPFEYIYQSFSSVSGSSHHQKITPSASNASDGGGAGANLPQKLRRPSLTISGHSPSQHRRSSLQEPNLAAIKQNPGDDENDVEFYSEGLTPRSALQQEQQAGLGSSIWRNVTNLISSTANEYSSGTQRCENEEENIYFNEDAPVYPSSQADVLQKLKEEEEDYEFAFSDFPRKDGTPCLMYSPQAIFRIGSSDEEDHIDGRSDHQDLTVRSPSTRKQQSENDAFRNMLSQHSMQSSFDEHDDGDDDANLNNEFEEETEDLAPTGKSVKDNAMFTAKLDRLMVNRHRQYEKKAIVEKHQKTRNARREKFRKEQEKRTLERHQAMENALESLEATTCATLDTTQFMKTSTDHRRVHSNASMADHRRTDSQSSMRSHRRVDSNMSHASRNGNEPSTPKRADWTRVWEEGGPSPARGKISPKIASYRASPMRGAPRSPMVIREFNAEAAARSPVVQFSGGIFRPSPHSTKPVHTLKPRPVPNFPSSLGGGGIDDYRTIRKSDSGRSVSPPGGLEGDENRDSAYRRPRSNSANVGSRPTRGTSLPRKRLEQDLALDLPKLSMPMPGARGANKISPTSVADEIMTPRSTLRPKHTNHKETVVPLATAQQQSSNSHRRTYSFDTKSLQSFDTIDGRVVVGSNNASSNASIREHHHSIGRTNSFDRRKVQDDDIMVHGIYAAKSRMV
eukprot:CAMPEP_0119548194 /NCGR_PEP_ID=MMETSP1352-20130426/2161_1 /TAXON_ID=265584 /ORGANISM="Stauroneis constricta, Strain CCMP1120" /LENGTH=1186 /DNA_ID=CAMNT_0007593383 /DNA_START=472 /DNA_END=4032 /DNA_ORIENTATION=+